VFDLHFVKGGVAKFGKEDSPRVNTISATASSLPLEATRTTGITPRWPASCRPTCAGATPKARNPDMLAAQRRERARIRSERQQRWGRPRPKAA
jgi:hypothetical protein